MPWNCYRVTRIRYTPYRTHKDGGRSRELLFTVDGKEIRFKDLRPGASWDRKDEPEGCPGAAYDGPRVILPGKMIFRPLEPGSNGFVWGVSGSVEDLVITPSINYFGRYHGFVGSNGVPPGVVGDDLEGRTFDEMGNRVK